MYPTSREDPNKETDEAVYFFTPAFYPLDNFSAHTVTLWDTTFPTAEHAYQWKKFADAQPHIAHMILAAPSPHAVKQIADAHKEKMPTNWYAERVEVMQQVLKAKAEQHEDVRKALARSGKKEIIENSPVDSFWGTGPKGKGENMVGKIWMSIRDSFNL